MDLLRSERSNKSKKYTYLTSTANSSPHGIHVPPPAPLGTRETKYCLNVGEFNWTNPVSSLASESKSIRLIQEPSGRTSSMMICIILCTLVIRAACKIRSWIRFQTVIEISV